MHSCSSFLFPEIAQYLTNKSHSLLKLAGIGFLSLANKRILANIDVYKKQSLCSTLICLAILFLFFSAQKNGFDAEIK
jgi:hypothetical protein